MQVYCFHVIDICTIIYLVNLRFEIKVNFSQIKISFVKEQNDISVITYFQN